MANLFKVEIEGLHSLHLYRVEFEPKIEEDDKARRNAIFDKCNTAISQHIDSPVFSGSIIYSLKKTDWDTKEIPLTFGNS